MRVIHLLRKLDPAEWGGTETAVQRLCGALQQQGVENVVFCPRTERGGTAAHDRAFAPGCEVRRFNAFVPVLGINPERKRQLVAVGGNLMSFDLVAALWREQRADIVHTHALGRIGGIGRTIARKRGLPFVVSIHGGVLDLPPQLKTAFNQNRGQGWEWGRLFGLIFKSHVLFRDADAIVACNEREAALLREQHPDKLIHVQGHGVPLELYRQDRRRAALEAFPRIAGRQLLVSLGRIDPVKNQGWLVEQAPEFLGRHPQAMLVLAGPCTDEAYGRGIEARIRELGIGERVLLTGALPPNDPRLIGLLQLGSAVVLASVSETFGLILVEAWAAGAPVISSATSGAKALVRHGENGWLFDLATPAAFHRSIDEALLKPDRGRQMAQAGHELVQARYSSNSAARQVEELYRRVIEEKRCVT